MPDNQETAKPLDASEVSNRWAVSLRTAYSWLADGVPVHDDEGMFAWYDRLGVAGQAKLRQAFRVRLAERRQAARGGGAGTGGTDYAAFEAEYAKGKTDDKTALADLKKQFAFYLFRERASSEAGDAAAAADALRQIKELGSVIHDMELRAQKLGRDMGDLVPRVQLETPARFLGYHMLRCSDLALRAFAKTLTERDPALPPVTAEEVFALGEPIFLQSCVVDPMQRAIAGDNEAAPPEWLVRAIKDGMEEVVEEA